MKRKRRFGIFAQLIFFVSGIILIPLSLLSIYFHKTFRSFTVDQMIETRFKGLNQLEQNLVRVTNELNAMIYSYDNSTEIEKKLNQIYKNEEERVQAVAELERHLMNKVKDYSWVDCNLILIGKNQTIFSSCMDTPKLSTEVIYNSYWYQKNKHDLKNVNYEIFNRSYFDPFDGDHNIVAIKNLVNYETGNVYGIAILEIKESYFYNIYKNMLEEGELLYLQTEERKVLSTSDRSVSLTLDPKDILLPPEEQEVVYPYLFMDKEFVYIFKKAETGIWDIVNLVPLEVLNLQFTKYYSLILGVELFSFAFALIGIIFIGNRIYVPLRALLDRLRKPLKKSYPENLDGAFVGQRKISEKQIKKKSFMEYEELMEEINQTIERLITEEEARKSAEIKALAMQIRPHFLYNTLNSIKCLVWTKEYDKIEPTITYLVKLLRNALGQGGQRISLEEERENIKLFVDILNVRMDGKIILKFDFEEGLEKLLIPSFFIQPLVENSIFHGMSENNPSLTIILTVYEENGIIVIEVMDTGVGVSEEKLAEINGLFSKEKPQFQEKEFHIGLSNVYNRLLLNYGEEASIRMNSQKNQGTVVRIKIKKDDFMR